MSSFEDALRDLSADDEAILVDGLEESINQMSDDEFDSLIDTLGELPEEDQAVVGTLCGRIVSKSDSESDSDDEFMPTTKEEYLMEINKMLARGIPCYGEPVNIESTLNEVRFAYRHMATLEMNIKEREATRKLREAMDVLREQMNGTEQGSGLAYFLGQMLLRQGEILVKEDN